MTNTSQPAEDKPIIIDYDIICDLRQPLTSMLGWLQLARLHLERGGTEVAQGDIEAAIHDAWRLAGMLTALSGQKIAEYKGREQKQEVTVLCSTS
ncbi:MAG: hypothetical protein HYY29_03640 [Chloroflexi bacterium]|nr:hypothetical protein [Chloroflexota bacterium]